MLASPRAPIKP